MNFSKHWSLTTGRLWNFFFFFPQQKSVMFGFFMLARKKRRKKKQSRRSIQCQVKKEEVQKYAGFDVGAHAARSTHSVCLISVFFVHFVSIYWAVSVKWTLEISPLPSFYKPTLFKNVSSVFILLSSLCVIYCAMTFYYFLLLYFFFYTHILINVYIRCVFFLNCLMMLPLVSLLLFGMKVGLQMSPEAQFSRGEELLLGGAASPFLPPLCTFRRLFFFLFFLVLVCGSSVLKALPALFVCRRDDGPALRLGQGHQGLRALTPHPSLKKIQ